MGKTALQNLSWADCILESELCSARDGPGWPLCILKTAQLSRGGLPKEQEEQEKQEGNGGLAQGARSR